MATQIILTAAGEVAMIVHDAADPSDKAWNPPDCVRVEIDKSEYDAAGGDFEVTGANYLPLLKAVEVRVQVKDPSVALQVSARIVEIEQAKSDKAAAEVIVAETAINDLPLPPDEERTPVP